MNCETFRSHLGGVLGPEELEHLRSCEECLNSAAAVDPFLMFRAIGGQEIEPPEGTDTFVAEVMQQIRGDERRKKIEQPATSSPWLRWGAAAAVFTTALTFGLTFRPGMDVSSPTAVSQVARDLRPLKAEFLARPVVEHYEGANAMIVEIPESSNDIQLVMIFDESLPADL